MRKINRRFNLGMEFERPDHWAVVGWTNTLEKLDYQADVVFFGNSITRGSDFQQYFDSVKICNLGYTGDNLDGMTLRMGMIRAVSPKKVFLMAGINGLHGQDMKEFEQKYSILLDSIATAVPTAKLYVQSILPRAKECKVSEATNNEISNANKVIEKIAKQRNITYIDLFSLYYDGNYMPQELTKDGLHLLPESYERWANKISSYIAE